MDTRLVLGTLLHVARAVERLHAAGAVHGGICDTSLVVTTAAPKAAQWRHGRDVQVSFGSLGAVAEPVHRSDLTAVRADMALFYAPERFDSHGMLAAPSAAGDIWAVGMLLVYCMRLSLPLVRDGFLVRPSRSRQHPAAVAHHPHVVPTLLVPLCTDLTAAMGSVAEARMCCVLCRRCVLWHRRARCCGMCCSWKSSRCRCSCGR